MSLGSALRIHSAAGLCALAACADLSGNTDLLGQPVVLQEMVTSTPDPAGGYLDALTDGLSGYMLIYGTQTNFDPCYLFDASMSLFASPLCVDPSLKCVCPPVNDDITMTCSTTGTFAGHCVDSATSAPPSALHALPFGTSVRIVVGDLLDGATLEHFACACVGISFDGQGKPGFDTSKCGGGPLWSDDPGNCSVCPGDAITKGRCLDVDGNGKPDFSSLIPGVATIACDGIDYVSGEGEGFYYPSGNQFPSSIAGLAGLGPAVVINPARPIPSDSDCTVTLSSAVKDHGGRSPTQPSPLPIFHTEPLTLSPKSPADMEMVTAGGDLAEVQFAFNAPIDPNRIHAEDVVVTDVNSSAVFTATGIDVPDPGLEVDANVTVTLTDGHLYQVTVKKTVADTYGKTLRDDATWSFSAVAQP